MSILTFIAASQHQTPELGQSGGWGKFQFSFIMLYSSLASITIDWNSLSNGVNEIDDDTSALKSVLTSLDLLKAHWTVTLTCIKLAAILGSKWVLILKKIWMCNLVRMICKIILIPKQIFYKILYYKYIIDMILVLFSSCIPANGDIKDIPGQGFQYQDFINFEKCKIPGLYYIPNARDISCWYFSNCQRNILLVNANDHTKLICSICSWILEWTTRFQIHDTCHPYNKIATTSYYINATTNVKWKKKNSSVKV